MEQEVSQHLVFDLFLESSLIVLNEQQPEVLACTFMFIHAAKVVKTQEVAGAFLHAL